MSSTDRIRHLAEPLLAASGLELWDVEVAADVVRVLVDRPGGIDLEALTEASGAISTVLDAHPEATPGLSYQLEVSSPGIERTLRTPEQYRRYLGSPVSVKTTEAVRGSRRWTGTLIAADGEHIEIVPETPTTAEPLSLGYDLIDRTRTVLVWGPQPKHPGGSARRSNPRTLSDVTGSGAEVKETP
jgi:ribosome maturation factor RimP